MLARITKLVWMVCYVFIAIDTLILIAGRASNWYITNYLDKSKIDEMARSWVDQGGDPGELSVKMTEYASLLAAAGGHMAILFLLTIIILLIAQVLSYLSEGKRKYLIYLGITLFSVVVVFFLSLFYPMYNFFLLRGPE